MEADIRYTEQWTEDQTQVAELTIQKAKAFNWLHHESYLYYSAWGRVTSFLVNSFVFLASSIGIIITNAGIETNAAKIIQTVFYGLFIIMSIVGIALGLWNPNNKATEHFNFAMKNKELYADLTTDMVELITHEQIHQMLIDTLKIELHMRDDAPIIPKNIWKKYYSKYGSKAIKMDILLCNDDIALRPITMKSNNVLRTESGKIVTLQDSFPTSRQRSNQAQNLYDVYVSKSKSNSVDTNADREIEQAFQYVDKEAARNRIRVSANIEDDNRIVHKITAKDQFELDRFNLNN